MYVFVCLLISAKTKEHKDKLFGTGYIFHRAEGLPREDLLRGGVSKSLVSPSKLMENKLLLGGRFGYFLFFLLGEGEGGVSSRRQEGGGSIFIGNPRKGGGGFLEEEEEEEEEGPRGREAVCGELGSLGGGGGAKDFFSGPKCPPRLALFPRKIAGTSRGCSRS